MSDPSFSNFSQFVIFDSLCYRYLGLFFIVFVNSVQSWLILWPSWFTCVILIFVPVIVYAAMLSG